MRSEIRWAIVASVLTLAGTVALWPLFGAERQSAAGGATAPRSGVDGGRTFPMPDVAELAPVRQRADLQPCPTPEQGVPPPAGPLAGVVVPCLGSPGTVDLGVALAGKPALLNVWASWCAPCRDEIPVLADYTDDPDAIAVVGINVHDRPANALALLADLDAHYPSAADVTGEIHAALSHPPVLPTTYILRADGTVERVNPPVVFRTPMEVRQAVDRYLRPTG